jgi:hypothetical protein
MGSARARCSSRTSRRPRRSSSSGRTRAPTTRACSAALQAARRRGAQIVASTRCASGGWSASSIRRSRWRHAARPRDADLHRVPAAEGRLGRGGAEGHHEARARGRARDPGRVLDHGFIRAHTVGFDALATTCAPRTGPRSRRRRGSRSEEIRRASDVYIRSRATIVCWAMGLTQHTNAVDNVVACSATCCCCAATSAGRAPAPARCAATATCRATGPSASLPAPEAGVPRPAGGGPSASSRRASRGSTWCRRSARCTRADPLLHGDGRQLPLRLARHGAGRRGDGAGELSVHVATKLNRSHLVTGGGEVMIWPCLGRTERDVQAGGEQFVTVEDSMSCVHARAA